MSTPGALKQLRDFDRASPQFHQHLSNFLCSEGYRGAIPSLQSEDLAWLVDYLDNVSLQTISLLSAPNTVVGSCVYLKSHEPHIPRILARTEKYLWCQRSPTEIVHGFKLPPGCRTPVNFWMRARGNPRWLESTDSTRKNVPRGRSAGIQDGVYLRTLSLMFRC